MSDVDILLELQEEINDLKDRLARRTSYAEALCRKLAERDAEIKVLREILWSFEKKTNPNPNK